MLLKILSYAFLFLIIYFFLCEFYPLLCYMKKEYNLRPSMKLQEDYKLVIRAPTIPYLKPNFCGTR